MDPDIVQHWLPLSLQGTLCREWHRILGDSSAPGSAEVGCGMPQHASQDEAGHRVLVLKIREPQMWVWPQVHFGRSPPPPIALEDPSLKPQPFPPRPPPPSSPPALALLRRSRRGWPEWRRGPSKRHLGPDRISGGTR